MGNHNQNLSDRVNLIANSDTWIEGKAIQQLNKTAELEGIIRAVGMPDLHPGRGYPIGAVFLSRAKIYPALIGNDIGCGMSFLQTDNSVRKVNLDKFEKRLSNIDTPLSGEWTEYLEKRHKEKSLAATGFEHSLGTIGGGNHFAELQQICDVYRPDLVEELGVNTNNLQLLVHSGSRGLGQEILRNHVDEYGHQGLNADTSSFDTYIKQHDKALCFAELNREMIGLRIMDRLNASCEKLLDINHNLVSPLVVDGHVHWIHRKGATPADKGLVMIPGSRGDYSYLVKPNPSIESLFSLAHGAGRKWVRSECKARLSKRYRVDQLRRTEFGSRVICKNKSLLYEEAPEAYKSIDSVIDAMQSAGLITPVARFKPVLTYKTQGECS